MGHAGPTMDHEDDWIITVPAANCNPLRGAADRHEHRFIDAVRSGDRQHLPDLVLVPRPVDKTGADQ